MSGTTAQSTSVEAKIVVLGTQGVGKTSLVHRYVKHAFIPPSKAQSTVGASFLTTRVSDAESSTTIRLQIWDTAGQERFRSISKLYYRGAHAAILCYDITSAQSFKEMSRWMDELREQCGTNNGFGDMIIHVVGTKSDVVAADPVQREVTFEQCIEYVAEQLYPTTRQPASANQTRVSSAHGMNSHVASPTSNRSSGFWGASDTVWDCCHEVSAKDGEGIDEVFRVITRKLVEQHNRRIQATPDVSSRGRTPGGESVHQGGYFDMPSGNGSFRLGIGDKRRSWLGLSTPGGIHSVMGQGDEGDAFVEGNGLVRNGRCCG